MKYYFFCVDASVLPQGHSVVHSVPDDEVILLPVPKKLKKRADPPENSACDQTTRPINLSDSEPGPYKSHLNVADSPTFPAALPSSSVHSSTTQECVVSESLDRVHVNVTVPTDEELNWTETQQNEDVQICAFVPDATPVQEPLTAKFQHPFSTSIRQSRQIVPNVNSNKMPPPMFAHQTNTSSHSIGYRVAVVWTVGGADEWFPGTVVEIENGKYKVRCDDGDVTAFRNASELVELNDAPFQVTRSESSSPISKRKCESTTNAKAKTSKSLNKPTDEPTRRENFVRVYGASYFAIKLSRRKGVRAREEVHKAEKLKQCQGFI